MGNERAHKMIICTRGEGGFGCGDVYDLGLSVSMRLTKTERYCAIGFW